MFGLIARDRLHFRVDDDNTSMFEAEGMHPFSYDGRGRSIVLPYWRVPERLLDETDELAEWARAALAAARRAAAKKPRLPIKSR
jgi:DNA transformation protein